VDKMAKEKWQAINSDQTLAEGIGEQQKSEVQQKPAAAGKPEEVLIGLEAFVSAKDLSWMTKARLVHYAEQHQIGEQTFEKWEAALLEA